MSDRDKILHNILTATQTGTIACRIAEKLNISSYDAFRRFIMSRTYANFRQPESALSYYSDLAIVDEFLNEK